MKKLLRLFAFRRRCTNEPSLQSLSDIRSRREALGSLAGFLDPSQIHTTKTGRASGRTCRKSLIINDQILHAPPKSSGNPEPIRSNPKLRAETCASGLAGVENPNGLTGHLHLLALSCTNLRKKNKIKLLFFTPQVQHLHFPDRAGPVQGWYCRDAPSGYPEGFCRLTPAPCFHSLQVL